MFRLCSIVFATIVISGILPAYTAATSDDLMGNAPERSFLGAGVRMAVSLLLVLALIVGSVFFLKKITPYKGIISGAKNPVSVLSRIPLGQKQSLCLVRIADEILVIGLTGTTMSLLSKMKAEEYYSQLSEDAYQIPEAGYKHGFQKLYSAILNGAKFKNSGKA